MREGDVGVALSVLYAPFDEMDLEQSYGAPPREGYFADILAELELVEDHVAAHSAEAVIAHSPTELDRLLADGRPVLIHCIEGGFQLGRDEAEVRECVRTLALRGVAYVTLAHLFWREVATNAPALPSCPIGSITSSSRNPTRGSARWAMRRSRRWSRMGSSLTSRT